MNYVRPEVAVLGEAIAVIESVPTVKNASSLDGGGFIANPAYDLDE